MEKKKVYLSGPDRLRKDARELFEEKKWLCQAYGFELPEYPEDVFKVKDSYENNRKIAEERLQLIRDCDIFLADTRDFRAFVEPFGETALEAGMAYAYEKKMYAYMPDARTCKERYSGEKFFNEEKKSWTDKDGIGFEPGPLNVMLEYSMEIIEGDLETALKKIRKDLEKEAA